MPSEPEVRVLFEDNHLFVVLKPAGLLSQADRSGEPDLLTVLAERRRRVENKQGNVYLGLVHRLDRNVAGVMVVAKTSKAAARLSEEFRQRNVRKIYSALVEGMPGVERGVLTHFIEKNAMQRKAVLLKEAAPGAQRAELAFEVVRRDVGPHQKCSLLLVELGSGRFHQIRAQLAASGTPVVGDKKYGARMRLGPHAIGLMASCLCFRHPISEAPMGFAIRRPLDWESG